MINKWKYPEYHKTWDEILFPIKFEPDTNSHKEISRIIHWLNMKK